MHWLNWRVASIGLRGGYFNDFPRHSWPGSTNQLPSDERRLLGFPGCAIYDDSPDLHNYFTCCLGFPMHTIRHDALNNPTGYINLPTGLANPVLTDSLIFPNWQFFIGAGPNGENILTTPAACLFGEEKVYPFVRVEWFVPIENSIYSTVQWVSESSRDTGKRMHFFDWGVSAPIYQFWAGSPPDATLTDDVYMEATEFFSYGGIYDRQTGKAKISPVPTF
jgi:hypothetical protein